MLKRLHRVRNRRALALPVLALFVLALAAVAGCGGTPQQQAAPRAVIETELGQIVIELFAKDAPETVANFKSLVEQGFYDSLTFHRVEPGFVVQGGDPNGNGTGGPGYTIRDEDSKRKHLRGSVGMAKSGPHTAGSQFYICLSDQPGLDGRYTVFGQVVEGMEVVDAIQIGDRMLQVYMEQ